MSVFKWQSNQIVGSSTIMRAVSCISNRHITNLLTGADEAFLFWSHSTHLTHISNIVFKNVGNNATRKKSRKKDRDLGRKNVSGKKNISSTFM